MALTPQGIMGLWLAVGIGAGAAVGVAVGRPEVGIPLGVGAGLVVGGLLTRGRSGTIEALEAEGEEAQDEAPTHDPDQTPRP